MTLIQQRFDELEEQDEAAFIPFVVLGDPDFDRSAQVLDVLAGHADLLELGFPFSDPIADGPRIQAADQRALEAGITSDDCFRLLAGVREQHETLPMCLLIYYNLIFARGQQTFVNDARNAGVNGVLVADMPIEEAGELNETCREKGLDQVFIVAPTTVEERMDQILSKVSGFVYTVAVVGVTGEREQVKQDTLQLIETIKSKADVPVCVGFGISRPEHVREMVQAGADGVIIGSALESIIENNLDDTDRMLSELDAFAGALKSATKSI